MDAISIPSTDAHYCQLCTYYISVYAYTNTTFTLVASFTDRVVLSDGLLQTGHANKGVMMPYQFRPYSTNTDITITLSNSLGQSTLYVSTTGKLIE
jgi:hypothetical protein